MQNSTYWQTIFQNLKKAGLTVGSIDESAAHIIDAGAKYFLIQTIIPELRALSTSWECEFFALRRGQPLFIGHKKNSDACLTTRAYHRHLLDSDLQNLPIEIMDEGGGDSPSKHEAKCKDPLNGVYPTQHESMALYAEFRGGVAPVIQSYDSAYSFRRFSEHLHISFKRQDGSHLAGLDPDFIRLFEESTIAHVIQAKPLVSSMRQIIGTNIDNKISGRDIGVIGNHWRYNAVLAERSRESADQYHHYELRRTIPGDDTMIGFSPMIVAQALVCASLTTAIEAYQNKDLSCLIHDRYISAKETGGIKDEKYRDAIKGMETDPLLQHSMGKEFLSEAGAKLWENMSRGDNKLMQLANKALRHVPGI